MWGGIEIFTKNNLAIEIDELNSSELCEPVELIFETVAIKLKYNHHNIIVIGTYRSPNSLTETTFLNKLGHFLQHHFAEQAKY